MSDKRNAVPRDLVPGFVTLVRRRRKLLKWSQRKLAENAGISPMCVCELESAHRSPSLRVATLIARALGLKVRLAKLELKGESSKDRAAPPPEAVASA